MLPDAEDSTDKSEPVGDGPSVRDSVADAPDIQQHGMSVGRPAVGDDLARDHGQCRIQPGLVQVEQSGVFLLQLQRGLSPGL